MRKLRLLIAGLAVTAAAFAVAPRGSPRPRSTTSGRPRMASAWG